MCGIVGIWTLGDFKRVSGSLDAMTRALSHRGPDAQGAWYDAERGVAFGHRRLAIIGLGESGAQPMVSASGRYTITFNGEIYNHLELRGELADISFQHEWRGQSDTETLLACVERFGFQETLRKCIGMFALAVWDAEKQTISLARDRVGEKPLYYGIFGGAFAFASELGAFPQYDGNNLKLNPDAVAAYMRHGYVPQPYSIYKGISKLMPGTWLELTKTNLEQQVVSDPQPYWNADEFIDAGLASGYKDIDAAIDVLENRLAQAVRSQLIADVPLGAFLSGGIDSSLVVALMQRASSGRVKTYTIGFEDPRFDEAVHARKVAKYLGTEHTELYLGEPDVLRLIPEVAGLYDEPFADSSQIPTVLLSRMARKHVKVCLSGDGGDELFHGYDRYPAFANYRRAMTVLPHVFRNALAKGVTGVPMRRWDMLFNASRLLLRNTSAANANGWRMHRVAENLGTDSMETAYRNMMSMWRNPMTIVPSGGEIDYEHTRPFNPKLGSSVSRAAFRDLISYLPDDILAKVDRAGMSCGLETRMPFLDRGVVEFALSLPDDFKRRNGMGKWLLRQVLHRHIPEHLFDRPKRGFSVPLAAWLRGPLREWAEDLLSVESLGSTGMLEPGPVRSLWQAHLENRLDAHYPIWNVLMFIGWLRKRDSEKVRS